MAGRPERPRRRARAGLALGAIALGAAPGVAGAESPDVDVLPGDAGDDANIDVPAGGDPVEPNPAPDEDTPFDEPEGAPPPAAQPAPAPPVTQPTQPAPSPAPGPAPSPQPAPRQAPKHPPRPRQTHHPVAPSPAATPRPSRPGPLTRVPSLVARPSGGS